MSKTSLFNAYERSINTESCSFCINSLSEDRSNDPSIIKVGPFSCWQIGEKKIKILFVGKNTWINKNDERDYELVKGGKFRDLTNEDVFSWNTYYFTFIDEIIKKTSNRDSVCVTNLVKCKVTKLADDNKYVDLTADKYYENCIEKVLKNEILELKPNYIIFLTNTGFNGYLKKLRFGRNDPVDISNSHKMVFKRGSIEKQYPWWVRKYDVDGRPMYMLVTRHPQGAWKEEFIFKIVEWINHPETVHL